jgi:hypothetical protein
MIPLALISVAYGLFAYTLFRRFVDPKALRRTVNRIVAHVISFRLFVDEPRLILRGQLDLLFENARLLRLLAGPIMVAALVFGFSYSTVDRHFGRRPLPAGESAVLTLPLGSNLKFSPAFTVETPPVRVLRLNQVSWRIRVTEESSQFTEPAALHGFPWQALFLIISTATGLFAARLHSGRREI